MLQVGGVVILMLIRAISDYLMNTDEQNLGGTINNLPTTSRPDYEKMDDLERLKRVRSARVLHPRMAQILKKVDRCRRMTGISEEPECLFVKGLAGVGKSTLMRLYCRQHPRRVHPEGSIVPVFYANVPAPASIKGLASALLHRLGDPLATKGDTTNITRRLSARLVDTQTELIMLDEFQHFMNPDTQNINMTVGDWLKNFVGESKRAMVIIGLPKSEDILDADEQLERRFAAREELAPFDWNTEKGQTDFRTFLHQLDELMPFNQRSHLASPATALRFYYASRGIIGYVVPIVRYAAEFAIEEKLERMDLSLFARAYAELKWKRSRLHGNPFEIEPQLLEEEATKSRFLSVEKEERGGGKAMNKRIKGKQSVPKATDILNG